MSARILSLTALISSASVVCSADPSDTPFEERVRQAEAIARGLRVDGNGLDWAGYTGRYSAAGNVADPSRDLTSSQVLADAEGIHVRVTTKSMPSRENSAFGFKLDFMDSQGEDVDFGETSGAQCPTVSYRNEKRPVDGVRVAEGACVEWYVPWDSLAKALPEISRDKIVGPNSRPWIRVIPYSMNQQHQVVDHGAAAACFRMPVKLDDTGTPPGASESKAIPDMVPGQVYVFAGGMQGPSGVGLHKDTWCYDLASITPEHQMSPPQWGANNANYPVFGRKLLAPVAGHIGPSRNDVLDHAPWPTAKNLPSNYTSLEFDGYRLWYYHNKQHSMVVNTGEHVSAGDQLAAVGDTGPSGTPHVHIALQHGSSDQTDLIPIILTDVKVSLNGGGGDFWARTMPKWAIQEGFFVEPNSRASSIVAKSLSEKSK